MLTHCWLCWHTSAALILCSSDPQSLIWFWEKNMNRDCAKLLLQKIVATCLGTITVQQESSKLPLSILYVTLKIYSDYGVHYWVERPVHIPDRGGSVEFCQSSGLYRWSCPRSYTKMNNDQSSQNLNVTTTTEGMRDQAQGTDSDRSLSKAIEITATHPTNRLNRPSSWLTRTGRKHQMNLNHLPLIVMW